MRILIWWASIKFYVCLHFAKIVTSAGLWAGDLQHTIALLKAESLLTILTNCSLSLFNDLACLYVRAVQNKLLALNFTSRPTHCPAAGHRQANFPSWQQRENGIRPECPDMCQMASDTKVMISKVVSNPHQIYIKLNMVNSLMYSIFHSACPFSATYLS